MNGGTEAMVEEPEQPRWRRAFGVLAVAAVVLALPACEGGHFCLLGYSSKPNYNRDIHTIYVPIFKNRTFRRGLEFDLTRVVVREIEQKTPYKVVSDCNCADTELIGTIISAQKTIVNLNPENEVRESEFTVGVEIIWRDRRTGEILSKPTVPRDITNPGSPPAVGPAITENNGMVTPVPLPTGVHPDVPPPYVPPDAPLSPNPAPTPVLVQGLGRYLPELGQSTATAMTGSVVRVATQIVQMMESPW
jgi:hypothetical protein